MTENTQKLWIELDDVEENGAFYLASPCKADLVLWKAECQCKDYFDSDTVYSNIVIQASSRLDIENWEVSDEYPTPIWTDTVRVEFARDGDEDVFVHEFNFPGESVTFTYMPEDSTQDEWEEKTLVDESDVNDPIMLEQALRSMDKSEIDIYTM